MKKPLLLLLSICSCLLNACGSGSSASGGGNPLLHRPHSRRVRFRLRMDLRSLLPVEQRRTGGAGRQRRDR